MSILVDPPGWPAHGRLWSHLVSDSSLDELHTFAARLGVPRQGFDRDHYDVPGEAYDRIVAAGAVPVSARELVVRLRASGLRRRRADTPGRRKPGQELLRPFRLRPGCLVAVVAPAGPVPTVRLDGGLAILRGWGLRVRLGAHVCGRDTTLPHLAAPDDQRAADIVGHIRAMAPRRQFLHRLMLVGQRVARQLVGDPLEFIGRPPSSAMRRFSPARRLR